MTDTKDQIIEKLNNSNAMLLSQLAAANEKIGQLLEKLDTANTKIAGLTDANFNAMEKVTELLEQIASLNAQLKALQDKQSLDSSNSSKPPSTDGLRKPNVNKDRSLRGSSGKKQGGQPGHKGSTYEENRKPDQIIQHTDARCNECPHREECLGKAKIVETRTVVDAKMVTTVTEHQVVSVKKCPLCHIRLTGKFPEGVNSKLQYGTNLNALVVSLGTLGAVSMKRIQEILGKVFNIPLSTGTIDSMLQKAAGKVASVIDMIGKKLLGCEVTHSDETGFRVDGKTRWAHTLCTDKYTLLTLSDFRGHKGMEEAGLLPLYKGINVHDCWASYWKFSGITHAICNAHILRELNFVTDNYPEQTWNGKFRGLLLEMKSEKEKALAEGRQGLSEELKKKFLTEYDAIIKLAYKENPMPANDDGKPAKRGRKKKGKVLSLVERLDTNKASVCLFAMDFRVPFDNNEAERSLRCIKVKVKVSGCFRTIAGAQEYLDIMSYLSTARKLGFNGYEAMVKALHNEACYIFDQASTDTPTGLPA